eukprot:Skav219729  [mRNA]  locus=scaffold301:281463:306630:- [translate_table: standard]
MGVILGDGEPVEIAAMVWVYAETASPRLGELVPNDLVATAVTLGQKGLVEVDGEVVLIAEIPQSEVDTFKEKMKPSLGDLRLIGSHVDHNLKRRYIALQNAVPLLRESKFDDWSFSGPRAVREFIQSVMEGVKNDLSSYHMQWKRNSGVNAHSSVVHEHRNITEMLRLAICRDQLDVSNLLSFELAVRRLVQLEVAVSRNPSSPEFGGLDVLLENPVSEQGAASTRNLDTWVTDRLKEKANIQKQSRLYREEKSHSSRRPGAADDSQEAGGWRRRGKAKAKAKSGSTSVDRFLEFATKKRWVLRPLDRADKHLAEYFAELCDTGATHTLASYTLFGFILLKTESSLPERQLFPLARQALKGWATRFPQSSRTGADPQIWYLLANHVADVSPPLAAAMLLQLDTYTRPSEVLALRKRDVVSPVSKRCCFWGIIIGNSDFGERTKAGLQDDTVLLNSLDRTYAPVLLKMVANACKHKQQHLFGDVTLAEYERVIAKAHFQCGLSQFHFVPHAIRHSGPSIDFLHRARTAEEIMARGRWATLKSIQRTGDKIHWFAILNSLMIMLFLSGMVAMILLRTLYRDITRYNELATAEEAAEETGWKLVHGDVFRKPAFSKLLAVSVGSGVQILGMSIVTLVFALLGFLSPAHRGGLLQSMMMLFTFMGVFGGYSSARLYKVFNGEDWKTNTLMTATLFACATCGTKEPGPEIRAKICGDVGLSPAMPGSVAAMSTGSGKSQTRYRTVNHNADVDETLFGSARDRTARKEDEREVMIVGKDTVMVRKRYDGGRTKASPKEQAVVIAASELNRLRENAKLLSKEED